LQNTCVGARRGREEEGKIRTLPYWCGECRGGRGKKGARKGRNVGIFPDPSKRGGRNRLSCPINKGKGRSLARGGKVIDPVRTTRSAKRGLMRDARGG